MDELGTPDLMFFDPCLQSPVEGYTAGKVLGVLETLRQERARQADLCDAFGKLQAELEACAAALPGVYYMDPPDGGDVPVSEQVRRMATDAKRYRWLRANPQWVGYDADYRPDQIDMAIDHAITQPRKLEDE